MKNLSIVSLALIASVIIFSVIIFTPFQTVKAQVVSGQTEVSDQIGQALHILIYSNLNVKNFSLTLDNVTFSADSVYSRIATIPLIPNATQYQLIIELSNCQITSDNLNLRISELSLNLKIELSQNTIQYVAETTSHLSLYNLASTLYQNLPARV